LLQDSRDAYAEFVVRSVGSPDPRLRAAFATIQREHYLGPAPWLIMGGSWGSPSLTADPRQLYQDVLVSLAADRGINNGQPTLHARCLAACRVAPGETVVHIGAGTGYYTAILAVLVGPTGCVVAYEIEADLAERARRNLQHLPNVHVVAGSATGAALPGADVVYVNAGATHPPASWLDALNPGGRLIFPLTPDTGYGGMLLVTRCGAAAYAAALIARVSFIPCIGARDEANSRALAAAFGTRPIEAVKSLRRDTFPDASAWCVGAGWWLSTREPASADAQPR
jgi:protein-L-isoaspartate(D-aspartate) O-methyltransferase